MAELTPIDRLHAEANDVIRLLQMSGQISLQISVADQFRKALLLAAASYFEEKVCGAVIEHVRERAKGSSLIENFIRNKAVSKQYHTWFSWGENNANQFLDYLAVNLRC